MPGTTMGVKLEENVRKRIARLGKKRQRSAHWIMRAAILEYLRREEAFEQEKHEDKKRWDEYQLTGQAISQKAMLQWFDELEAELGKS